MIQKEKILHANAFSRRFSKDIFKQRCEYFANEIKTGAKVNAFLKRCVKSYVGEREPVWTEEEKEWKVEMIDTYFPGFKEKLEQYVKDTEFSRQKRKEIQEAIIREAKNSQKYKLK